MLTDAAINLLGETIARQDHANDGMNTRETIDTLIEMEPKLIELLSAPARPSARLVPAKSPEPNPTNDVRNAVMSQHSNLNAVTTSHSNSQIIAAIRALANSILNNT